MSPEAVRLPWRQVLVGRRYIWYPAAMLAIAGALLVVVQLGLMAQAGGATTGLPPAEKSALKAVPQFLFTFHGASRPDGIAVSPDGDRIFVAESGGEQTIKVFNKEGKLVARMAPPDTDSSSRWPTRLAVDGSGWIYAVDRWRSVVDVYTPDLQWKQAWRPVTLAARDGWRPSGVSAGPDGRIYVTQIAGDDPGVLVFDNNGRLMDRLSKGLGLATSLYNPTHAVADGEGRVYVGVGNPDRLVVVGRQSVEVVDRIGKVAINPRGLALGRGMLFLADASSQQVLVLSLGDRPAYLGAFGRAKGGDRIGFPSGVAVDAAGRVYVADLLGSSVNVYSY